jgi:hypothetical protein
LLCDLQRLVRIVNFAFQGIDQSPFSA